MKASKFPKAKVQTQGFSWLLLDLQPISAGVASKSIAYKKTV